MYKNLGRNSPRILTIFRCEKCFFFQISMAHDNHIENKFVGIYAYNSIVYL